MSRPARGDRRGRRAARVLGLVAGVLALAAGAVWARSEWILERRHPHPPLPRSEAFAAPADAALLDRGRHLVTVVAQCTFCHGPDLAGREIADDPWIGRLHAPNLTRGAGGVGARYAAGDWAAALRHGLAPDGRSLLLMPSAGLARLSDRDLAAIVAYLQQVPAIDREVPAKRTGWLTRVVVAAGLAPDLLSAEQARARPDSASAAGSPGAPPAPTAVYGEYLVALGGCRVCHRADLAGGLHPLSLPGEPIPPDLTPRGPLGRWSQADFVRAMREGRTPDGRLLDRAFMPWPAFAGLDAVELEAIWRYLERLEPERPDERAQRSEAGKVKENDRSDSRTDLARGPVDDPSKS